MALTDIGKTAVYIPADRLNRLRITNVSGGTAYYAPTNAVSASDTAVAAGVVYTQDTGKWWVSASSTKLEVEPLSTAFPTGGIVTPAAMPGVYAGNWNPPTATSGTDTGGVEKKLFLTSLVLPYNKTLTGIGYLVGSVGGTNKVVAGLFDASGTLLAKSTETSEGTTAGTAAEIQELAFTAAYNATGPNLYYIGITMNGNTAKLRTIIANTAGTNIYAGEVELAAKNVLANVSPPTTFTAGKGPIGWVY